MTRPRHRQDLNPPKPLLYSIFAIVLFTVGAVGIYRLLGFEPSGQVDPTIVASQDLRLTEVGPGDVEVRRAEDGRLIATVPEDDAGFLRGMMRSLGRQRTVAGVPKDAPYRLSRRADGSLTMEDPRTGESIALRAYGPDNRAQMAELLRLAAGIGTDAGADAGAGTPGAQPDR